MGQLSNLRRSIAVCELLSLTAWFMSSENGVPLIFASIGLAGGGSFSSIDRAFAAARSSSLSSSPMWSQRLSAKFAMARAWRSPHQRLDGQKGSSTKSETDAQRTPCC